VRRKICIPGLATTRQINLLRILELHPGGVVIRHPDGIKDLAALTALGFVQDVFERAGGEWVARISPSGREEIGLLAAPDS
jgi:hypothetical protein